MAGRDAGAQDVPVWGSGARERRGRAVTSVEPPGTAARSSPDSPGTATAAPAELGGRAVAALPDSPPRSHQTMAINTDTATTIVRVSR
ncbi:hypothetical protein [Streptomyces sp. NRRL S-455]|uniref:hypothetical protein n=1 Tax=Streptomyces sp. NRRL S-455 TaxID=1463908 RepID=UPI00131A4E39|nr:hypothetical protein [Streptomyces sp. NRRL S-455]